MRNGPELLILRSNSAFLILHFAFRIGGFAAAPPRGETARTPTAPGRRPLGLLRSRPDPVRGPTRAPGPAVCPRGGCTIPSPADAVTIDPSTVASKSLGEGRFRAYP